MYKFRKPLVACAGLFLLLLSIALVSPKTGIGQANRPTQDVRLVDTTVTQPVSANSPLPVTGNVGITGTPSVNVVSMPTVNGTVTVANTSGNPVPVIGPSPQTVLAFSETKDITLDGPVHFGPYDVSSFRDIRISFRVSGNSCPTVNYILFLSDGSGAFVSPNLAGNGSGSTLVSVPGQRTGVNFACAPGNGGTAFVEIYGRP